MWAFHLVNHGGFRQPAAAAGREERDCLVVVPPARSPARGSALARTTSGSRGSGGRASCQECSRRALGRWIRICCTVLISPVGHPSRGPMAVSPALAARLIWERYEGRPPWGVTQRCPAGGMSRCADRSHEGATRPCCERCPGSTWPRRAAAAPPDASDRSGDAPDGAQPAVCQRGGEVCGFRPEVGTKACSPIGLGGNVSSVCIIAAAWPVRSFRVNAFRDELLTGQVLSPGPRPGVLRWGRLGWLIWRALPRQSDRRTAATGRRAPARAGKRVSAATTTAVPTITAAIQETGRLALGAPPATRAATR